MSDEQRAMSEAPETMAVPLAHRPDPAFPTLYCTRDDRGAPPTQELVTRDLTSRALTIRGDSIDEDTRSFEAIMATDAPAAVYDWSRGQVIDETLRIDGASFADQVILLESHNAWSLESILGSVRNMRNEKGRLVGRAQLMDGDERADSAWNKIRQGHLRDVSIGYRVLEYVDIPAGQSEKIEGKKYTAERRTLRVTTKFEVKELSLVPIGADANAKIRTQPVGAGPTPTLELSAMNETLRKFLEGLGLRADASEAEAWEKFRGLEGTQRTEALALKGNDVEIPPTAPPTSGERAAPAVAPAPAPAAVPAAVERSAPAVAPAAVDEQAIRTAERERQIAIRGLANDSPQPDAVGPVIEDAITRGLTLDQAKANCFEAVRSAFAPAAGRAPAAHTREDDALHRGRALAASMMIRCGVDPMELPISGNRTPEQLQQLRERAANDGEAVRNRHMLDLCEEALRIEGINVPHKIEDLVGRAVSTATLTYVFQSVIETVVAKPFELAQDTSDWCQDGEVENFKVVTEVTRGTTGGMTKHRRGGQAEKTTFDDAGETGQAIRFSERLVIDDMDFRDDSFGLLTEFPQDFAEDAATLRPDIAYGGLLLNAAMVDTGLLFNNTAVTTAGGHANLTTAVLGPTGLEAAHAAMRRYRRGNKIMDVRARYLLIPPDLEHTAWQLLNSEETRYPSTAGEVGTKNAIKRMGLVPRSDERLAATGYVDPIAETTVYGSATNWFLAADRRTIKILYMRGANRRPVLRVYALTDGKWGMGIDMYYDIGRLIRDYRGLHRSAGTG